MFDRERASLTNQFGDELLMTGWSMVANLQGMALDATLEQLFVNSTGDHAEIIYNFPLPWGAELIGLVARIGEGDLVGFVVGKKESQAQYEETLSQGNTAILLEKNAGHDYTLNLGGIKPNETVSITVRYGQLLRFSKSGLRLSIPTVIAPRFGDPMLDGGLKRHQVAQTSLSAEYPFTLEVNLHGIWADSPVESPTHSIKVGKTVEGVRKISLAKASFLDRDFVLSLQNESQHSLAIAVPDYADTTNTMILAAFKPELSVGQRPVNVKILVDCSGSMEGDSIEAARNSLQAFVADLTDNDHFSLSKFGSVFMHRSKGLWTATEPAKLAAQRWIETLEADMGGTEMGAALLDTFELASTEPADVLLVTDGDIHAVDHIIELAKESKHRLFIVGIGSASSESHLRRMAEATLGACDFVAPGEDVGPAVTNMFARMRNTAIRDLKLTLSDATQPAWIAPLDRVAYDGDTVYACVRVNSLPQGDLSLSGVQDDGEVVEIGSTPLPTLIGEQSDLSRLAVAKAVHQQITNDGPHYAEGQKMAVNYQLVTEHTNLLMVLDRGSDKATDMPEQYTVDQMLPAGYGGVGSVKRASIMYCIDLAKSQGGDQNAIVDFSQYDLPPGLRSGRSSVSSVNRSSRIKASLRQSIQNFDIPAFLRKEGSKKVSPKDTWELDVCDSRLYEDSIHYEGLTPLGVQQWVCHTKLSQWPTTFEGLIEIGVTQAVVDWLELLVASEAEATEGSAVASFLYAFLSPEVELVLKDAYSRYMKNKAQIDRFVVSHDLNKINVDAIVYSDVVRALECSVDGCWPDCMFDMEQA